MLGSKGVVNDPDVATVRDERKGLFLAHKAHVGVDGGKARIVTAILVISGNELEANQLPRW